MPSNPIKKVVISGDSGALTALLDKKQSSSWRAEMQKALHSKRVTALHYAALLVDIESARVFLQTG